MNKLLGNIGEEIATEFLKAKGYMIIDRNLNLKIGEIDILAKYNESLILVEVKTGRNGKYGPAYLRVGPQKINKLINLALAISQKYQNHNIRIDVINVDDSGSVTHIENAIEFNN